MILRILHGLGLMLIVFLMVAQSPGDYDLSFGDDGKVVMGLGNKINNGSDFIVQEDDKILATGPSPSTI